jgi:predicted Ser/Thr protein kinase
MSTRGKPSGRLRRQVGRYELIRELGRGGMATVYLARQLDLDRRVALKELRPQGTWDPSFARRFLREARLAGSFSHPNIVTVHDYFEQDHVPYIAMEYLAGGSLRPYIGRLKVAQVGGVLEGLLAGLSEAERHEVVHRDIKPENLLVTNDGGIKIADFGIAKAKRAVETGSLLTVAGSTLGTPNYIAPEQAMAQKLGPWTDLYSVGVLAFEMLVGRTPFGDTQEPMGIVLRQINDPLPRISELVPSVHESISEWVGWLASKSPDARPQSAKQAWDALDATLLAVYGPQWRRGASLVAPSQVAEATSVPTARATPRLPGPPAPPAAAAAAAAVAPAAAAAAAAATLPPRKRGATAAPVRRGPYRVPTLAKAVIVVAGLIAAGALALNAGKGASLQSAAEQSGSGVTQATPTRAASPAQPSPLPEQPTKTALADEAASAQRLATTYRSAATEISKQSATGQLDSADAALVTTLQQTARSYDTAAGAAAAGDVAGYTAAMAAAEDSKRDLTGLLNGTPGAGLPAPSPSPPASTPSPTPTSTQESSCAGDSKSDDPSDDACGPA